MKYDIWNFLGIRFFDNNKGRLLKVLRERLKKKEFSWIATVNPEFVMESEKNKNFKEILKKTDFNVIDGIGLIWAKMVENEKLKMKRIFKGLEVGINVVQGKHANKVITGADLVDDLCKMAEKVGYRVYFLGGWQNRAEQSAKYFLKKYPKLRVAGFYAGMRSNEEENVSKEMIIDRDRDILRCLGGVEIDILFVAYAMKKQEEWIWRNLEELKKMKVRLVMGVGRSMDYYSGELKRAPSWVRRMGFEWLYSLIKEPKRWKRQLELPKFVWKIIFG